MKVHLMHPTETFDPERELPAHAPDVEADLGLGSLIAVMAQGDRFLEGVSRSALFQSLTEPSAIVYRQDVLDDCVRNPDLVRRLYDIATEAGQVERAILLGWHNTRPRAVLERSRTIMVGFVALLRRLRAEADAHVDAVASAGMRTLFGSVRDELPDDYLDDVERYLSMLSFRGGLFETAQLGMANEGTRYVLRSPPRRQGLWEALTTPWTRHTVTVAERDMAGAESVGDLQEHACAAAAEALGQSADHVKAYFLSLRRELGFYLACLNLRQALVHADLPLCRPCPEHAVGITTRRLIDPLLVLHGERRPVGSSVEAVGSPLIVITGANQGGKSTFLRALGVAQLMMQCGLFVAAEEFVAAPVDTLRTHFRREEDSSMVSGKFDEELARMSDIVDSVTPASLLLCNESFASTNEREAAAAGGDVIKSLLGVGVRVHLVTHQYELAERLHTEVDGATFLRAARLDDGTRSHEIGPGDPLRTSFGADLYDAVMSRTPPPEEPESGPATTPGEPVHRGSPV